MEDLTFWQLFFVSRIDNFRLFCGMGVILSCLGTVVFFMIEPRFDGARYTACIWMIAFVIFGVLTFFMPNKEEAIMLLYKM
jgi:hypothetical protein